MSADCCVMNGRRFLNNDSTSFNNAGQPVIDYGIVPYGFMNCYVLTSPELYNSAKCIGCLKEDQ